MPGNSLPPVHKKYTFNSEAKRTGFDLSLFADDTTIIGSSQEIEMGKKIIEEVMGDLKSRQIYQRKSMLFWGMQIVAI